MRWVPLLNEKPSNGKRYPQDVHGNTKRLREWSFFVYIHYSLRIERTINMDSICSSHKPELKFITGK